MIRSVTISNSDTIPTTIDMINPKQTGFVVDDIDGLGAGKAEVSITKRASLDGDVHNGARLGTRNIRFAMGFGRALDPEIGREESYVLFPLQERVKMEFKTDKKRVEIYGIVESNEPEIFTQNPSFAVSVLCVEPYFKSLPEDRKSFKLFAMDPKFQFPFKNDSLTDKKLIMGEHKTENFGDLAYTGSVPTGVLIRFAFSGPVVAPSVTLENTNATIRIDSALLKSTIGSDIKGGDLIEIDTRRGNKGITLIRDGFRIDIKNAMARTSKWITISRGVNRFSVNADSGFTSTQVEIFYDTYYSGL